MKSRTKIHRIKKEPIPGISPNKYINQLFIRKSGEPSTFEKCLLDLDRVDVFPTIICGFFGKGVQ